jgi:hypothetical protein
MAEKRVTTYDDCHCPHCRHPLDGVSNQITACPLCNRALEPREVWMTRKYPGLFVLPGWLKAFGWPFLLMLAGFGIIGLSYATGVPIPFKLPGILITLGMVFFIVKLATNGEDV